MLFLKRPVAPYFVPVPELDGLPPSDQTVQQVEQPPLVGGQAPATTRSRIAKPATTFEPRSPRIAEVLALEEPTIADLGPYLGDSDPGVRRTAVATLAEHTPDGYAPALFAALDDPDAAVRRTGADGIRELVEVLPDPAGARAYLFSRDVVVRAAAVYLLAARRAGAAGQYRRALTDPDYRVRIEAVRALVAVGDVAGVVGATGDENREVRIAAAAGLATLRGKCGHTAKENRESQAVFLCLACGHGDHADHNAAEIVLARAGPAPTPGPGATSQGVGAARCAHESENHGWAA